MEDNNLNVIGLGNKKISPPKQPSRRDFLKEALLVEGVVAAVGSLATIKYDEKKDAGYVQIEITEEIKDKITNYINNILDINLTDEDISSLLIGLESKPIERNKPIQAYHKQEIEVLFVIRKVNNVDKLFIEVLKRNIKIAEEIFEINKVKAPRPVEEPDWHTNPKSKKERPPVAV